MEDAGTYEYILKFLLYWYCKCEQITTVECCNVHNKTGALSPFEKHVRKTRYTRTFAIPEWCENITEIVLGIVFITAFIKLHATGKRGKSPRNKHATRISKGIPCTCKKFV
jgi:hypothetical protein